MVGALMHNQKADYTIYPDNLKNHILLEFFLDDGSTLIYSDYRRFGSLRVVTNDELTNSTETHLKTLQQMGPEPFEAGAYEKFLLNIRHTRYANKPIKDVLLDQRVVAGAGNIYANEALFPLGIHPATTIANLPNWQLKEVFKILIGLLELSISMGGSSIRDYVDGEGKSGTFQTVLKLYGKTQCEVCDSFIEKTQINKRATFHCPFCQAE
jgi:formamidopyrimidine-DNA glycosylase